MDTRTPSKPCPIRFKVRDGLGDDAPLIHDKTGDHNDRYFRDWITDTTWWALRNGKAVTLEPTLPH